MNPLSQGWRFVPLFGLRVRGDDDGALRDPIWDDATLVSVAAVEKIVAATVRPEQVAVLSQQTGLSTLLSTWTADLLPKESLVEPVPHSFIAVRRRNAIEAEGRAAAICAFLTSCMFLRGHRTVAFTLRGDLAAWWLRPGEVFANDAERGQTAVSKSVYFNEFVAVRPVEASLAELQDSWRTGIALPLTGGAAWDIHRETSIAGALMDDRNMTAFKKKLRLIARHVNDTCATPDLATQVLMSVTALETILGTNDYGCLKTTLCNFLPQPDDRAKVERLFKVRNDFAHSGAKPDGEFLKGAARDGLVFSWLFLDVAALHTARFKTHGDFIEFTSVNTQLKSAASRLHRLHVDTTLLADAIARTMALELTLPSFASQVGPQPGGAQAARAASKA